MKKRLTAVILLFTLAKTISAQNYGFGTSEPQAKVHVAGSFLVSTPTTTVTTAPTPAQHRTMINDQTSGFGGVDSTGRFYDPGGPAGNYLSNLLSALIITQDEFNLSVGTELIIESIDLGTGDSVIIESLSYGPTRLLAIGNGYTSTGKWIFNTNYIRVIFKSNADAVNGAGFSILFRRLFKNNSALQEVTAPIDNSMFFDIKKGIFRAGYINTSYRGQYSTAMGSNAVAGGWGATSLGNYTVANGDGSVALGSSAKAIGTNSVALGWISEATGNNSVAMGMINTASGENATAIGSYLTASGQHSTAMGKYSTSGGYLSFAAGYNCESSGYASTAMGYNAVANGTTASISLGYYTTASASYSTALGSQSTASGDAATASGNNVTASGNYSTAMGNQNIASGVGATAMGGFSVATGDYSTAMGYGSATGLRSTAMGDNAIASGAKSTAMGYYAKASGSQSTAIGNNLTANGSASTAMGNFVSTNNKNGAFIIGDNSTTTVTNSANPNTFRARFDGGYIFYTSSTLSSYCLLAAGANAWSTASDKTLKENLASTDGEDFLKKIAKMELTSWNYKSQDARTFRHYGPMAQDFYAAFGKDKYGTIGNDTTINSADFDGVNLIAIQALEKRTTAQKLENDELKNMLLQIRKEMDELKKNKKCDCDCPNNLLTTK
ncbi:MAG: hypothetical protein HOP10_12915 [Chitinophagaceae bacterium]|nr:hypothetical protein [Chitinophagaceae bacterium]